MRRPNQKYHSRLFDVTYFNGRTGGGGLSQMQKIEIQTAAGSRRSSDAALRGGEPASRSPATWKPQMELCLPSRGGFVRDHEPCAAQTEMYRS